MDTRKNKVQVILLTYSTNLGVLLQIVSMCLLKLRDESRITQKNQIFIYL